MQTRNVRNQRQGAAFENFIDYSARRDGLLAVRNGQQVRWLPNGKMLAIKSNLDWTLLTADGRAAFVDSKSFKDGFFTYSMVDSRQLQLSSTYMRRGFNSGFVCYLRELNKVVFYSAQVITDKGARSRFSVAEGLLLGDLQTFSLRGIFAQ